jgi:hypothetical protein
VGLLDALVVVELGAVVQRDRSLRRRSSPRRRSTFRRKPCAALPFLPTSNSCCLSLWPPHALDCIKTNVGFEMPNRLR